MDGIAREGHIRIRIGAPNNVSNGICIGQRFCLRSVTKSLNRTRNQHPKLSMVLFSKRLNSMVAAVFGVALCAHGAQAPHHVNINQLSTTVEDFVVPLSNEISKVNEITTRLGNDIIRKD
jgi:hypothetical protein